MAKLGGELRAEIHQAVNGSTRPMHMALLGHMAMTLGRREPGTRAARKPHGIPPRPFASDNGALVTMRGLS